MRTVVLTLYVLEGSSACDRALRNLERVLARVKRGGVDLTVRNLSRNEPTDLDRTILVVPTLASASPVTADRAYLVGDLDPDEIEAFLVSVGVRFRG